MAEYHLYFLDDANRIQGRHVFHATDDADALWLAKVLGDACSDVHHGCELWCEARAITEANDFPTPALNASLIQLDAERQQRVLAQVELMLMSHFRIAESRKLLKFAVELKDRVAQGPGAR